jgi:putative ABC transport system ATP-binding protein
LLLADEPTGNLDPDTAADILQLIRNEIRHSAASGIIVTHSPAAAASADRILLLTREGLKQISADEAHAR